MVYIKSHCSKMKFSITDFFNKCDQIRRKLRIWSHLLKKSLMENFIFFAVSCAIFFNCQNAKSFLILDFSLCNNYLWNGWWELACKGSFISLCNKQALYFPKKYSHSFRSIYSPTDIALIKVHYSVDVFAYLLQHGSKAYLEPC